ncbi:hypothetical protein [Streptomyces albidoflavus]|uniref:hypothetical protein n=1 Tax=Streptomyces albidoflavus TaxID=1886 RepID=UPI0020D23AEC|nr:hypothetical protein [Streptomyces albidoflavus]
MSSRHVTATTTARHRLSVPGGRVSGTQDGQDQSARVTAEGAAWLASAGAYPGVAFLYNVWKMVRSIDPWGAGARRLRPASAVVFPDGPATRLRQGAMT